MLCTEHNTTFHPGHDCPGRRESLVAGQEVWLDSHVADRLVNAKAAVYPTHQVAENESIRATLDRANRAFTSSGLPSVDAEFMDQFRKAVRTQSGGSPSGVSEHYGQAAARPSRLASSLGLSAEDLADMKAAIKR